MIRAVGVVSGDAFAPPATVTDTFGNPGMGSYQNVPRGLDNHAWCWGFFPERSAACGVELSGGPVESVSTAAGRYNPAYYAIVGWPLKFAPNWTGLVLARMLSGAMSAALLACAFCVLSRWSRFGLMFAGLVAVSTPMLAHLAGAVNPNGVEISAGIALFAAGIPLLLGPPRGARAPLVALAGVSAVLLVTLRSLGPVWLFFALFALLVPFSWARIRELWRLTATRIWTVVLTVATVLSALWIILMKTGELIIPERPTHNFTTSQAAVLYFKNWGSYLEGMVGVAGWFDVKMPAPFYWAWISMAASLVVFALVVGSRTDRWRFFVMVFGGVVVPGVLQVSQANIVGFIIGGRYMMPLMVGLPLLAAFILERKLATGKMSRSLTKLFCLIMMPTHLVLLVYSMVRWQQGIKGSVFTPFQGSWLPQTGPYLPVLLMIAGIALTWWITLRAQLAPAGFVDLSSPVEQGFTDTAKPAEALVEPVQPVEPNKPTDPAGEESGALVSVSDRADVFERSV